MAKRRIKYKLLYALIVFVLILDLFFTYLLKYSNQDLSLSEFSILITGNIINLLITLILVAGISLLIFKDENKANTRIIIIMAIVLNAFLILAIIFNYINIPLPDYYVYDYHISRILTGILFFIYLFALLIYMSVVWLFILGYHKLLFLRAAINTIFIFVLMFVFSVFYINMNNKSSDLSGENRNNVGVVLGAAVWTDKPSPSLSSRADKAAKLLKDGKISRIQLTGSNAPGEMSESQMAYNYLDSRQVDMTKVDVESKTTSTNEQIKFIRTYLYRKSGGGNIIIISDNYHLSRIKEICRFQNMNVKVVASDLVHSFRDKLYYNFREAMGIIIFWMFAL